MTFQAVLVAEMVFTHIRMDNNYYYYIIVIFLGGRLDCLGNSSWYQSSIHCSIPRSKLVMSVAMVYLYITDYTSLTSNQSIVKTTILSLQCRMTFTFTVFLISQHGFIT